MARDLQIINGESSPLFPQSKKFKIDEQQIATVGVITKENATLDYSRPWYFVNRHTLPSKMACVTAFMAFGAYWPNATVFLTSIGLTKTQTGIVAGVCTLADIFGNPLWGAVADKTRSPKWVLLLLTVMSACLVTAQPWIAHRVQPVQTYQNCFPIVKHSFVKDSYAKQTSTISTILNDSSLANASHPVHCDTLTRAASSKLFYTMLAVVPFSYVFLESLPNAVETRVFKIVESSPSPATFGQQRYFGSVSYGISSVIAGLLADNVHHEGMSPYTAVFYWYAIGLGLLGVVTCTVFFRSKERINDHLVGDVNVSKLVLSALNLDVVLFLITALMTGIANGVLHGFLFIYLEELNASKFEMGLNILLSCAAELLVFPFSAPIIRFVRGNRCAMALGLFMYFPRFLMVSYFKNIWLILSTHILHGLCFALFWAAAVDYVNRACPKEVLTSMLGILNAIYSGLGQLISNFVGGVLYDQLGGRALYLIAAISCVIWSAIWSAHVAITYRRCRRRESKSALM